MKLYELFSCLTFPLVVAFAVSCSEKSESDDSGTKLDPDKYEAFNFNPDRNVVHPNPLCGWVLYAGLGNDLSDFWDRYDALESTVGKVCVTDYARTLLVRTTWGQLNPEEGVYIWQDDCNTVYAQRYRSLVSEARKRNMRVGFGFSIDSRDKHEFCTPLYVRDKGAKGYDTTTGSMAVWSPYPDDPVFQECYEKFIQDFAKEINDPDHYEFVHGVGIGKWGEYHSCIYSTGDETPKKPVFEWVTSLFAENFTKIPIFINYHKDLGSTTSSSGNNANPDSEGMVQSAADKGFGIGSGAFGMKTYYGTWEKNIAARYRYQVPVIAEGGWVKASHGDAPMRWATENYADWAAVRQGEFDQAREACASMMDFRYNDNVEMSETWSWFNEAYSLVEQFIKDGNYRLYPVKIVVPKEAVSGSKVTISHKWANIGYAYCPTNFRPFVNKYKVAFALLDADTGKPVRMFYDENAQPHDWTKGNLKQYTFDFTLSDVPSGDYIWAVGIVDDASADKKIGIYISAKGNYTEDNWLELSKVTVK